MVATLPQKPVGLFTHLWRQQIDLILIALTVALFYLAFPSGGYAMLAWIAIVPVLLALPSATQKQSFYLGFLAALLGWMASIWWAVDGVARVSQSHPSIILPLIFIFCVLCALPYGVATWLCRKNQWLSSISGAFKFTIVLTLLINFLPQILPGNLAHSLYLSPEYIQLASIGGVPFVFFIVHAVNVLIALSLLQIKNNLVLSLKASLIALAFFMVNLGIGHVLLSQQAQHFEQDLPSKQINVAYVQPNFNTSHRTRGDWPIAKGRFDDLIFSLAPPESEQSIDLIILPEIPIPISYQQYAIDEQALNAWSKVAGLLYAGIGYDEHNELSVQTPRYFNSVEYISDQSLAGHYDKQKLLPFAEYLPFEQKLPWLRSLFPYIPRYQYGDNVPILVINENDKLFNIVPLICYEGVFSDLVGQGVDAGGELLVNVVNDAWFGQTAGKDVHLSLTLFRSVEYRKPLIRVTNSGISGLILPTGELVNASVLANDTATSKVISIDIKDQTSFYADYPYAFALFCVVLLLMLIVRKEKHVSIS